MDDYDLRRLWSFENKILRLSQDELVALMAVDQHTPTDSPQHIAGRKRDQPAGNAIGEVGR